MADLHWVIPKALFVLAVLSVVVLLAFEAIERARGNVGRQQLNYSLLTFFLLCTWLTSEGAEIALSRFKDPFVELKAGLADEMKQHLGQTYGRYDRKAIFDGLVDDVERGTSSIEIISWSKLDEREEDKQAQRMYLALRERLADRVHPIAVRRL